MRRLSWSLVSIVDGKTGGGARMTYAGTRFDLKRLMKSLSEKEDIRDCAVPASRGLES